MIAKVIFLSVLKFCTSHSFIYSCLHRNSWSQLVCIRKNYKLELILAFVQEVSMISYGRLIFLEKKRSKFCAFNVYNLLNSTFCTFPFI